MLPCCVHLACPRQRHKKANDAPPRTPHAAVAEQDHSGEHGPHRRHLHASLRLVLCQGRWRSDVLLQQGQARHAVRAALQQEAKHACAERGVHSAASVPRERIRGAVVAATAGRSAPWPAAGHAAASSWASWITVGPASRTAARQAAGSAAWTAAERGPAAWTAAERGTATWTATEHVAWSTCWATASSWPAAIRTASSPAALAVLRASPCNLTDGNQRGGCPAIHRVAEPRGVAVAEEKFRGARTSAKAAECPNTSLLAAAVDGSAAIDAAAGSPAAELEWDVHGQRQRRHAAARPGAEPAGLC